MEKINIEEELKYIDKVNEINKGRLFKYYILTMGCQLNENDSEKLSGMLEKMNYKKTLNMEEADLVLFNTCCVRENAEEKLFGKVGEVKKQKENKGTIIAIGGCMMQEEHIVKKLKQSYPYVDIIFGTHTLHIVPYVRGRERSRNPRDIIEEVRSLAKQGYKEITLLGQNVNSYLRVEREKKIKFEEYEGVNSFATLLRAVNKIEGIEKIRFVSPHPKDFTDDVIEAIRDCEKVSKIVHLPLQSGSTNVLKVMNRKYTKEQYLSLVEKMKKMVPNIVFSTDLIVGFPGETEKDFEDTLDVVEKVHFEQVFMFIYSRRVGTPGDRMENQIPEEIKHKRFDKLKELVESQIKENNDKYIGTIQRVLVEGVSKTNKEMLTARTDTNKVVVFEGNKDLIGNMIDLKIVSEHMWYLKGEIC